MVWPHEILLGMWPNEISNLQSFSEFLTIFLRVTEDTGYLTGPSKKEDKNNNLFFEDR